MGINSVGFLGAKGAPNTEQLAEIFGFPPEDRSAFLRFARGDPFAVLADAPQTSWH